MGQKKILIVDDDRQTLEVLRDFLEMNGYTVMVAMDGMQAQMQAMRENPDLIFLDIMLPAGSGYNVFDRLRLSVKTQHIPIIILSATPSEIVKNRLEGASVPVLEKPWKSAELLSIVQYLLKQGPRPENMP